MRNCYAGNATLIRSAFFFCPLRTRILWWILSDKICSCVLALLQIIVLVAYFRAWSLLISNTSSSAVELIRSYQNLSERENCAILDCITSHRVSTFSNSEKCPRNYLWTFSKVYCVFGSFVECCLRYSWQVFHNLRKIKLAASFVTFSSVISKNKLDFFNLIALRSSVSPQSYFCGSKRYIIIFCRNFDLLTTITCDLGFGEGTWCVRASNFAPFAPQSHAQPTELFLHSSIAISF